MIFEADAGTALEAEEADFDALSFMFWFSFGTIAFSAFCAFFAALSALACSF